MKKKILLLLCFIFVSSTTYLQINDKDVENILENIKNYPDNLPLSIRKIIIEKYKNDLIGNKKYYKVFKEMTENDLHNNDKITKSPSNNSKEN
ncbi:MAG: hypothetical protein OEV44_04770 [Spirochaetota bacterium]|nr:hypothetical protein [Spirochaetota bacterium]